jgi:hypothetical protein
MIFWTRAERDCVCGGCNNPVAIGDAIRVTEIVGLTRKFIRCADCADAAIPPELAPFEPRVRPVPADRPPHTRQLATAGEWLPYREKD